jgi:hypothetical protein
MGRKYKRKPGSRTYADYAPESLTKALEEVEKGRSSLRFVAEKYGISKSTLQRKSKGLNPGKWGKPTALTSEEEKNLVHGLVKAAEWGFPFSYMDIRTLVKGYLDRRGVVHKPFKDNLPGTDWCASFLERNKELSVRMCNNIKRGRAEVSHSVLKSYFENLIESLANVTPDRIINFDETNMTDDPGRSKVITRRGSKRAERVMDSSKSSTSVMFAGSASGTLLAPYVVYKSEHLYDSWMEGGPKGCRFNRSKSGWFDGKIFEDWFFTIALPFFRKADPSNENLPKVLLGDNLASHLSLKVIEACEENSIRFVFFPPNSTHLCQPLDVSFFGPLKRSWRSQLLEWKMSNKGAIPKDKFPRLLKKGLDGISELKITENLKAGFKACGIFPLNPNEVLKRLPNTSSDNEAMAGEGDAADTRENNMSWSESFVEVIKTARFGDGPKQRVSRKKVSAAPGESVSVQHFEEHVDDPGSTSEREEPSSESSDDEDCHTSTGMHEIPVPDFDNIKEGIFLLVKLNYGEDLKKSTEKFFICKVIGQCENNEWPCSFLRKSSKCDKTFIFPNVIDELSVKKENVIKVLDRPIIRRGRHTFDTASLNQFKIQ